MRKRKLTKKNLDELAKKMPVLSEDLQRSFVAGTRFYNLSGDLIHQTYDGSDSIRVISDMNSWAMGGAFFPMENSFAFNEADSTTVKNILSSIGKSVGINGDINIGFRQGTVAWVDSSGCVFFNMASDVFDNANYYDILSVLNHENHHQKTPHDFGTTGSELAALEYEMSLSTFQLTSQQYQNSTIAYYNSLKNK